MAGDKIEIVLSWGNQKVQFIKINTPPKYRMFTKESRKSIMRFVFEETRGLMSIMHMTPGMIFLSVNPSHPDYSSNMLKKHIAVLLDYLDSLA